MGTHTGENYLFHLAWLKFRKNLSKKAIIDQEGNSMNLQMKAKVICRMVHCMNLLHEEISNTL